MREGRRPKTPESRGVNLVGMTGPSRYRPTINYQHQRMFLDTKQKPPRRTAPPDPVARHTGRENIYFVIKKRLQQLNRAFA